VWNKITSHHLQESVVAAATKNHLGRHQEKQNQVTQQLQWKVKKEVIAQNSAATYVPLMVGAATATGAT